MHIPANAIAAVALMAVLTIHLRFATERFWVNPGWTGRVAATLLLMAIGWMIAPRIQAMRAHDILIRKANSLPYESTDRMAALKEAYQKDPMDPQTVIDIMELYREWGSDRYEGYQVHMLECMKWARIGMNLNPLDPNTYLNFGISLHWLDRHEDARKYFDKMIELDPENHYLLAFYGWHFLQLNELEEAQKWLMKSWSHKHEGNDFAHIYLKILQRLLAEKQKNR
jgi:tetratricopeptide (TPR) repeat protein